jgi:hypothetical protein
MTLKQRECSMVLVLVQRKYAEIFLTRNVYVAEAT